jgi:hypothetical protein
MCAPRVSTIVIVSALAAAVGSSACAEVESAAEWHGSVRDSSGVDIVVNLGAPLWREEDRWTLTEVLRIGSVSGDPQTQFGDITGIAVQSDGTIVVSDRMGQHLKFFAPDGSHLRTVGTSGSGPREFGSYIIVARATGDTLFVMDWSNMQAHWLAPDGTWLGSWKTTPADGWRLGGWDSSASGRIVTTMTPLRLPDSPVADTMDVVLVRDVHGTVLDTLALVPTSGVFRFAGEDPEWHLWAGYPDYDLTWHGGIVTGRSDLYRLHWYDDEGALERIVSLHRERSPITDQDRTRFMDRLERVLTEAGRPAAQIALFKSAVSFEDLYPAWRRFICGVGGTLWVQRQRPVSALSDEELEEFLDLGRPPATPYWDVFDPEGRYLGVMDMPTSDRAFYFAGDRVYGVWEDELDVQYIVAWRIEGLPAAYP